ncbi:DMT family transporter [Microvirga terrestris]|uniref:DMT family transporter n=1 Tax=Microvirga terrestris TaxID=2791024 RepID=A0ABS0HVF6_9HYPH|nr:DMT family transporter [Microvirga terrestris]MBF9197479.1 DMT family transporter [Microvirga terrestris]
MRSQIGLSGRLEMIAAMALSGTIGYFVVESGQSVWNVVFFRCLFGALSLFAYCWAKGMLVPWPFSTQTLMLALLSGAAIVLNWVLLFSSYGHASISIATAVYNTQPFFLILLGMILFGERPTGDALGFIALAFVGLLMVTQVEAGGLSWSSGYMTGLLQALGAAFLYAVASVIVKQLKGIPPHVIALVQAMLGTLMLLPLADFSSLPMEFLQWGYLAVLGVVHTGIMYILLYAALQKLPTPVIAVLSFIYPAVAILVDYLAYGRDLSLGQWSGILLILLGSAGVNLKWRLGFTRPVISSART